MIEEWKDIPEYENLYQVSNFGRVKSLKSNKGEKNSQSKLTIDIIKNIRENKYNLTQKEFAALYQVSRTAITRIVNKTRWEHVS